MRTRKSHRTWLLAGGIAAAVAASGGAFTAGLNTAAEPDEVVAAANVDVVGGTVLDVEYVTTYNAGTDSSDVTGVNVELDGVYPQDAAAVDLDVYIDDVEFTNCQEATSVADADSTVFSCITPGSTVDAATATDTHIIMNSEAQPS